MNRNKYLFFIIVIILLFTIFSCSDLLIKNNEGFRLWRYYRYISSTNAVLQSYDLFVIDDIAYTETIKEKPFTITNILDKEINIKITDLDSMAGTSRWISIPPIGSIVIEKKISK